MRTLCATFTKMNPRKFNLGDAFTNYGRDFNIELAQVQEAFAKPMSYCEMPHGLELFYRQFESNDRNRQHLLLGTHNTGNEIIFAFCYWLPGDLVVPGITLENMLIAFISMFGLKIRIAGDEYFLAKDLRSPFHSKLETPEQIVSTVGDQNIPCNIHANLREEQIGSINWIHINYCFAINNNRYLIWLNHVSTETIGVPLSWYDYFKNLIDILKPDGKTKLKVLKARKTKDENEVTLNNIDKQTEIQIPSFAKNSFNYILKTITELSEGEKILVVPDYNDPVSCIFCGSYNISSEHIFPKWMREYFSDNELDTGVAIASNEERLIDAMKSFVSYNKETLYGFTTDYICVTCNTGWMSTLETKVKCILIDESNRPIDTTHQLLHTNEQRLVIAQWLLLKTLCIIRKSKLPFGFPNYTYNDLRTGKIAEGFVFEAFLHNVYDFNFVFNKGIIDQRLLKVSSFDFNLARNLSKDFFCITIHVAKFLFRISFFDESKGLVRKTCIRKTEIIYPLGKAFDHHTIKNEDEFWKNIEVGNTLAMFNTGIFLTDKKDNES
jgi:hypothetical protein